MDRSDPRLRAAEGKRNGEGGKTAGRARIDRFADGEGKSDHSENGTIRNGSVLPRREEKRPYEENRCPPTLRVRPSFFARVRDDYAENLHFTRVTLFN